MNNFFDIIKPSKQKEIAQKSKSAIIQKANVMMQVKTYYETNSPLYYLSYFFATAYHILSYLIACLSVVYLLYRQTSLSIYVVVIVSVISCLLLFLVEYAKQHSANVVFAQTYRKDYIDKMLLSMLIVCTLFSVVTSVSGAYFATKEYANSQTATSLNVELSTKQDSILTIYKAQKDALNAVIAENKAILEKQKVANWQKNVATQKIETALQGLEKLQEKESVLLQDANDKNTKQSNDYEISNTTLAMLIACIFLLFEAFNLLAYTYMYAFAQKVVLESYISKPVTGLDSKETKPVTTNTILRPYKPQPSNNLGFMFGSRNESVTAVKSTKENEPVTGLETKDVTGGLGVANCANCNKQFQKKTYNHKFCSEDCRIENWQIKTGKKVFKK
ncbi:MAG: hypothetical protein JJT94_17655 [Bernardetiaceae bacterium]|nr:hypothetical protein [Bernardetiaceae bacterium]